MGIMEQPFEKPASKTEVVGILYKDLLKLNDFSAVSEILDAKMESAEDIKIFLDQTSFSDLEKISAKIERYRNERKEKAE